MHPMKSNSSVQILIAKQFHKHTQITSYTIKHKKKETALTDSLFSIFIKEGLIDLLLCLSSP